MQPTAGWMQGQQVCRVFAAELKDGMVQARQESNKLVPADRSASSIKNAIKKHSQRMALHDAFFGTYKKNYDTFFFELFGKVNYILKGLKFRFPELLR